VFVLVPEVRSIHYRNIDLRVSHGPVMVSVNLWLERAFPTFELLFSVMVFSLLDLPFLFNFPVIAVEFIPESHC